MSPRSWRRAQLLAACLAVALARVASEGEEYVPDGELDDAAIAAFDKPLMPPFPDFGSAGETALADLRSIFENELNETSSAKVRLAQVSYERVFTRFKYGIPPSDNNETDIYDYDYDDDDLPGNGTDVGIASSGLRLIRVRRDGKFAFFEDGKSKLFYFTGTNNYGLATSYVYSRSQVREYLKYMSKVGVKVVRTWCFGNGYGDYEPWHRPVPFQGTVGEFSEEAFAHLDYVIQQANIYGVRLVCTLGNSLPDFGGIEWYVNKIVGGGQKQQFYHDEQVKKWYKNYVSYVLNRRNSITGRPYKSDPAIFSWQLLNEPNLDFDYEKRNGWVPGSLLREWVCEMSDYIKSLGARQMISIGDEGYRTDGRTTVPHMAWINGGSKGADFVGNLQCPSVSYATVHWYPETFGVAPQNATYFTRDFLADRAEIARAIGKPIVLEEFGMTAGYMPSRNELFEGILSVTRYHGYAGTMVWQLHAPALLPANPPMDLTLQMDGGKAISKNIKWTQQRNNGRVYTPPPNQPPCVDYKGNCYAETNGGNCWDYVAGECMATCNQCGNWAGWDASRPGPRGRTPQIIQ